MRCLYFLTAVAQNTGCCENLWVILVIYVVAALIGIILTVVLLGPVVIVPFALLPIFIIFLRLHMVKKYEITSNDACCECMAAYCCAPCATAQSKSRYNKNAITNTHSLLFCTVICMCAHESYVTPASYKHRPTFLLYTSLFPTV
jgi:Cys-rich protein (TIGR01571 family)